MRTQIQLQYVGGVPNSNWFHILMLLSFVVLLQACGKTESTPAPQAAPAAGNAVVPNQVKACTQEDLMPVGRVYDHKNGEGSTQFWTQIRDFVSGFTDPSQIGYVSGLYYDTTRVELTGKLKFDEAGNVIPSQTYLRLAIYDQNAVYSNTTPFYVSFAYKDDMVVTGKLDRATGRVDVQFSDRFGAFSLSADYDGRYLSGLLQFSNRSSHNGGSPKSGQLGAFYISACAIL